MRGKLTAVNIAAVRKPHNRARTDSGMKKSPPRWRAFGAIAGSALFLVTVNFAGRLLLVATFSGRKTLPTAARVIDLRRWKWRKREGGDDG
jgi:hypothetical protein